MINRVNDLIPSFAWQHVNEARRLLSLPGQPVFRVHDTPNSDRLFEVVCSQATYLMSKATSANDLLGVVSVSAWLQDGPKMFRPSVYQCDCLAQIKVPLSLEEYSQPYPALLVDFPPDYGLFHGCLCYLHPDALIVNAFSRKQKREDIVAVIRHGLIEVSLESFGPGITSEEVIALKRAERIAVNSCLALTNYNHTLRNLLVAECDRDRRLSRECSPRGVQARQRLREQIQIASFDQEITLHREVRERAPAGTPTGATMPPHWRNGHWHRVVHGKGRSERRLQLYPPTMVRPDLFIGKPADTSVTYKG